ncbi:DUF1499 domain-containing protein [Kordiimonas aestuarii]|uniref:DUF1499 domain-containing protein n=1 Tax=Kordiimonas aestuarii TaxID=1005925 RepID=UPI0021D0E18A|nr:DUF1499 domain-containing protein [Kordiimonas aestuarii]
MSRIFFKKGERKPSIFSTLSFVTACLAAIAFVVAGPAFRIDVLNPAFLDPSDMELRAKLLHVATRLVVVAAAFALVGIIHGSASPRVRISWRAIAAIVIIVPLSYLSWTFEGWMSQTHRGYDVTTNPADPPAFSALQRELPERAPSLPRNNADKSTYRDLLPITITQGVATATRRAVAAAQDLGWEIVKADEAGGTIEARQTSRWFGFESLITVRVRGKAAASILDIRAVSRLGTPDMGNNARLIRKFREALEAQQS